MSVIRVKKYLETTGQPQREENKISYLSRYA